MADLLLVGLSTIFSTVFGMLMGIYGGWKRGGGIDLSSMGVSLVLYAMPEFWLGILLLITFAVGLVVPDRWIAERGHDVHGDGALAWTSSTTSSCRASR